MVSMVVVGLVWRWIAVYQVVGGLPAKGADQMNGQLDEEDHQNEGRHAGIEVECRKYELPVLTVDCPVLEIRRLLLLLP